MDLPRLAVRASVVLCCAFLLAILFMTADKGNVAEARPAAIMDQDGSPIPVPTGVGRLSATWNHLPVLVFVATAQELDGVEARRGAGEATPSVAVPGHPDLRLFVLSATSTHLGCIVGWNAELGASMDIADYDGDGRNDGRVMDPCHHGQWDAFHRGAPQPATPAPARLAALDVRIMGDHLEATSFDGPTGPQR
ncbi:MAG TPA: hypothetical protein VM286_09025 [Candidatus Thermoplasmatota archaeon]|nr:hypothetical protein [Candidatus Thermoplasmatota archaeon]